MTSTENVLIPSPCIRNCCLDDDDVCLGCFRSLAEVTGWSEADNTTRSLYIRNANERRQGYHDKYKRLP